MWITLLWRMEMQEGRNVNPCGVIFNTNLNKMCQSVLFSVRWWRSRSFCLPDKLNRNVLLFTLHKTIYLKSHKITVHCFLLNITKTRCVSLLIFYSKTVHVSDIWCIESKTLSFNWIFASIANYNRNSLQHIIFELIFG